MSSSGKFFFSELPEEVVHVALQEQPMEVRGPGVQQPSCFGGGLKHKGRVNYHKM